MVDDSSPFTGADHSARRGLASRDASGSGCSLRCGSAMVVIELPPGRKSQGKLLLCSSVCPAPAERCLTSSICCEYHLIFFSSCSLFPCAVLSCSQTATRAWRSKLAMSFMGAALPHAPSPPPGGCSMQCWASCATPKLSASSATQRASLFRGEYDSVEKPPGMLRTVDSPLNSPETPCVDMLCPFGKPTTTQDIP